MDLIDENIGHFLNEVMLPTWHGLLNVDLIPAHVKKCAATDDPWILVIRCRLRAHLSSASMSNPPGQT